MEGKRAYTVVIVDDDPGTVALFHDVLAHDGFRPTGITDPAQVEDVVQMVQPDIFLIDIMLNGTSGIELAARLREGVFPGTPPVAMTGSPYMAEVARESGLFACVLEKPLALDELEQCLLACLREDGEPED